MKGERIIVDKYSGSLRFLYGYMVVSSILIVIGSLAWAILVGKAWISVLAISFAGAYVPLYWHLSKVSIELFHDVSFIANYFRKIDQNVDSEIDVEE